jgi:hypothetical protein
MWSCHRDLTPRDALVMPGLVPGIHVLPASGKKDVDGRGEVRP